MVVCYSTSDYKLIFLNIWKKPILGNNCTRNQVIWKYWWSSMKCSMFFILARFSILFHPYTFSVMYSITGFCLSVSDFLFYCGLLCYPKKSKSKCSIKLSCKHEMNKTGFLTLPLHILADFNMFIKWLCSHGTLNFMTTQLYHVIVTCSCTKMC